MAQSKGYAHPDTVREDGMTGVFGGVLHGRRQWFALLLMRRHASAGSHRVPGDIQGNTMNKFFSSKWGLMAFVIYVVVCLAITASHL